MTTKTKEKSKNKGGRPTKLTPELQERICEFIRGGNYFSTACFAVGLGETTFYKWMERGEEKKVGGEGVKVESPFKEFREAIKKAEAEAEVERVARIREAGVGGAVIKTIRYTRKDGTEVEETNLTRPAWEADMTHLERRTPDRWGRRQEIVGKGGRPVEFRVTYDKENPENPEKV